MKISAMNGHWRFYSLEKYLKTVAEIGFKEIELWTGPMHFYVDAYGYQSVDELKDLLNKYGLKIVVICPEQTNPKPNNIASAFRIDEIKNYYFNIIKLAHELNVSKITITSGWAYYDEDYDEAYQRSISMMKEIAKKAKKYHITLVMEALQPSESLLVNTSLDLKKYIENVGADNLKVCIDFGAMAKADETITDYFNNCGDLIEHVHFVDGKPTGHLAYGDGTRDIYQDILLLKKFNYHGYLSLESVASRYFEKPWLADLKNYEAFQKVKELI